MLLDVVKGTFFDCSSAGVLVGGIFLAVIGVPHGYFCLYDDDFVYDSRARYWLCLAANRNRLIADWAPIPWNSTACWQFL